MSDIKLACDVAEQVRTICDKHGNNPGELINILHEAQHLHGYLPEEMQRIIASKLNIESIWSGHLLYLLHHDPERETSHLRLHGYGMLRARLREVTRRIQTRTRHRSRRNHTRWKILIGLPALRRCLRTGSGSDDWRESVRKIATDRCEEDYRGVGINVRNKKVAALKNQGSRFQTFF